MSREILLQNVIFKTYWVKKVWNYVETEIHKTWKVDAVTFTGNSY